jgi:hypothetical protein
MDLAGAESSGSPPSRLSRPSRSWEENFKRREITSAEWGEQRELFTRLYFAGGRRLDEVRKIMAAEHGFYAKYIAPVPYFSFSLRLTQIIFCA